MYTRKHAFLIKIVILTLEVAYIANRQILTQKSIKTSHSLLSLWPTLFEIYLLQARFKLTCINIDIV